MNKILKNKKIWFLLACIGFALLSGISSARAHFVDSFVGDLEVDLSSTDMYAGIPDIQYSADFTAAGSAGIAHAPEPSTWMLFLLGVMSFLLQLSKKVYAEIKKFFDFTASLLALIILSPVMLIIAILIKLDSPGPIFYSQKRIGFNHRRGAGKECSPAEKRSSNKLGRPFLIYKFRSMYCDAEIQKGAEWAKKNDSRITRIGKILRKTRLDEIPQFFNVLKGEMSIIGPRPERLEFVRELNKRINYYHRRHDMKPGITGLAQTRFKYAASIQDTRKKLKYDLLYLKRNSFLLDLNIMLGTCITVILSRGAQ